MSENEAVVEPVKAQEATTKSNVKSDASTLPQSSDPEEILKQVEFYFSNENLPNDKFLYKTAQKNNGWVPITTICMFSRMKRFRPVSAVVDALRQSKELLEVSEDGELVRRKSPLVEPKKEEKQDAFARSVYAKGFGEETSTSQFDIEKFFETFGKIKQVRLRRDNEKKFKSSVFVEFASLEDAEKFLSLDPKPKFNDVELLTMSKLAYVDMKAAEHGFTVNASGKNRKFNAFRDENNDNKRKRSDNNRNKFDNKRKRGDNRNRNDKRRGPNDRNKEREGKEKDEGESEKKSDVAEEKVTEKPDEQSTEVGAEN